MVISPAIATSRWISLTFHGLWFAHCSVKAPLWFLMWNVFQPVSGHLIQVRDLLISKSSIARLFPHWDSLKMQLSSTFVFSEILSLSALIGQCLLTDECFWHSDELMIIQLYIGSCLPVRNQPSQSRGAGVHITRARVCIGLDCIDALIKYVCSFYSKHL